MTPCNPFTDQLEHLYSLARKAGFREYALTRALQLEADESQLWTGLHSALQTRVSAGLAARGASAHPNTTKPL